MILRLLIGAGAGAVLGFGWHKLVGCSTGACPLTANPVISHSLRHDCGCIDRGQFSLNLNPTNPIMKMELIIRRFAGIFILASLLLAHYHSLYWLWVTAFVGFNLLQSSFTKFCPLEIILKKLGVSGSCCGGEKNSGEKPGDSCCCGDAGHKT